MIYDFEPKKGPWDSNMKTPDAKKNSLKVTQTADVAEVDLGLGAPGKDYKKQPKGQVLESRLKGPAAKTAKR